MNKNYYLTLLGSLFYRKSFLMVALLFLATTSSVYSQTITYSFANAQITNDGTDDFYEADILLSTDTDFALGAGQFYLDYNTAAFGTSIHGGNLTYTHPAASATGYVLDERIFGGALNGYNTVNANSTTSKLSISWSTSIAGQVTTNITSAGSPVLICHIKIKFEDVNEAPNISFDTTTSPDAVTSYGLTFTDGGTQLTSDSYDSSGAVVATAVTWDGSEDSDWATAANWGSGSVPTSTDDVVIANAGTAPVINSSISVKSLTVESSASLTINGGGDLTVDGDLTVGGSSTLTINSDASSNGSLIVTGSSTGNITYNRHASYSAVSAEGWHLIASPVVGETEDDIISNGSLLTNGSGFRSFASYNNSYTGGSAWDYINGSATGTLDSGKGYSAKSTGASIAFTGTVKTDDLSNHAITEGTQNAWNLIGNPYPSFVAANISANGDNFLSTNIGALNPSFAAIYMWNSSTLTYEVINNATGARYIAPGQGFFVNSNTGGGTVSITEAMLSHQSGDLFLKSTNKIPAIKLYVTNGTTTGITEIKYIEGTTTSLDVGYDAGLFNGATSKFGVYSHLVSNSKGVDFTLQCLPPKDYENMVIPIGLNAVKGSELSFSTKSLNLPPNMFVYIEDRVLGTTTRIDEPNTSYKVVLDTAISGVGRFYIHTTPQVLSVDSIDYLESISVYVSAQNTIRIAGLKSNEKTDFTLYNLLGERIFEESFTTTNVKEIEIPKSIKQGIYIVNITTDQGKMSKKLMLNPR